MTTMFDPTEIDPREDKLPVWARQKIDQLRRRLATVTDAATQSREGADPENSRALVERWDPRDPLPAFGLGDETVVFRLGEAEEMHNHRNTVRVRVTSGDHRLQIMGDYSIRILPRGANVVEIEPQS